MSTEFENYPLELNTNSTTDAQTGSSRSYEESSRSEEESDSYAKAHIKSDEEASDSSEDDDDISMQQQPKSFIIEFKSFGHILFSIPKGNQDELGELTEEYAIDAVQPFIHDLFKRADACNVDGAKLVSVGDWTLHMWMYKMYHDLQQKNLTNSMGFTEWYWKNRDRMSPPYRSCRPDGRGGCAGLYPQPRQNTA